MRKFAAFILTTVTILSLVIIPTNARYFSDVNIGHWARESINYATDNGFIDPVSTYTFNPDGNFTRADVAKMIYRFEGSPAIATTTQFTDVSSTASYAKAVSWMASKGIMGGTSNTTFEPNTGIKRQDLAVVFFRYGNYLKTKQNGYIKNSVMEKQADITGFSDYSSITGYALEAVSWAVATKLITGEVGGLIEPKKIVVRETGAELLKRFGLYIVGMNWGTDNYSFTNSPINFTNTNYISPQHLSVLRGICNLMGEMSIYNDILTETNDIWEGACHGMCLSLILDKVGKLDINGAVDSINNAPYDLPVPKNYNQNKLVSLINFYHQLQGVSILINDFHENSSSVLGWTAFCEMLKERIDEYGIAQMGIEFTSGGWHALVVYDYIENANQYTFLVYDPNNGTGDNCLSASEVVINKHTFNCSLNKGGTTTSIKIAQFSSDFQNSTGGYAIYDLDSYYNDFNAGAANTVTDNYSDLVADSNSTMLISARCTDDFVIINDRGDALSYNNGEFSGDMDIVAMRPIIDGDSTCIEYVIKVHNSSYFICSSSDSYSEFAYMNGDVYSKISGSELQKVRINASGDIVLQGNNKTTYRMTTHSGINGANLIEISGFTNGNVSIKHDNSKIIIDNTDGIYSISTYDTDCYDIQTIRTDYNSQYACKSITISESINKSVSPVNVCTSLVEEIDLTK